MQRSLAQPGSGADHTITSWCVARRPISIAQPATAPRRLYPPLPTVSFAGAYNTCHAQRSLAAFSVLAARQRRSAALKTRAAHLMQQQQASRPGHCSSSVALSRRTAARTKNPQAQSVAALNSL
eukprot:COSAG01_NODE_3669_length_5811_cov_6.420868_1_plen_124_part_00